MRDGFREIVSGWMLADDFDDLTDRIERSAEWAKVNGPLQEDEQATVQLMIKSQIARGIRRGDFEPFIAGGEPPDDCPDCGSAGECLPGCPSRLP